VDQTTSCDSFVGSVLGKATAVQGQYLFQLGCILLVVLLAFSMFCMQVDEPKVQGQGLFPGSGYHSDADPVSSFQFIRILIGTFPVKCQTKNGEEKMFWTKKL
jgi:hypothetical protein